MPNASVATQIHEPLNTNTYFTPQVTFDGKPSHLSAQHIQLFIRQVTQLSAGFNADTRTDCQCPRATYAIDRS
jgi:hypothetical protein